MSGLFSSVLTASLWGGALTVLFLSLNKALMQKLPIRWHYYIWIIVLVRMLVPVFADIDSDLFAFTAGKTIASESSITDNSIDDFLTAAGSSAGSSPVTVHPDNTSESRPVDESTLTTANLSEESSMPEAESQSRNDFLRLELIYFLAVLIKYLTAHLSSLLLGSMSILWTAVAAAICIQKLTSYFIFMRRIKSSNRELPDRYSELFIKQVSETDAKFRLKAYINGSVTTPFAAGVFRPIIILPDIRYTDTQLAYIFKHEITHIKRHDIMIKWLFEAVKALHWFNPLVYAAAKNASFYCEASCDEVMMKDSGMDERKEYSLAIIDIVSSDMRKIPLGVAMASTKSGLKRRISLVLNRKRAKSNIPLLLFMTLLSVSLGACSGFRLKDKAPQPDPVKTVESANEPATVTSEPEQTESIDMPEPNENKINILIAGVDKKDDPSAATDAIMLASFDPASGKINLVSIPRDTYIKPSDETISKLSANSKSVPKEMRISHLIVYANKSDKMPLLQKEVSRMLNVPVDNYIKIDMAAFVEIVDTFGGVTMKIPEGGLHYSDPAQGLEINLEGGVQTLTGDKALQLCRYRSSYVNGDLGRIDVQQQFISQIYTMAMSDLKLVDKALEIFNKVIYYTETDLTLSDMTSYLQYISKLSMTKLQTHILPGETKMVQGMVYYIPDIEEFGIMIK